jgi:hypothetical protein
MDHIVVKAAGFGAPQIAGIVDDVDKSDAVTQSNWTVDKRQS